MHSDTWFKAAKVSHQLFVGHATRGAFVVFEMVSECDVVRFMQLAAFQTRAMHLGILKESDGDASDVCMWKRNKLART